MSAQPALHPLFASILASAASTQLVVARAVQATQIDTARADYESALRRHDWGYEFSDDGEVYRRGREALKALREQQARIDSGFAIWNSIAPAQCGNGATYS